jgi:DNA modification methylase
MTRRSGQSGDLFIDGSGQLRLVDRSVEQQALEKRNVECFGLTFPNDDARRAYFTQKLREKLADPEFRKNPGFPRGLDDDIARLSDPPYFTACPNPFLREYAEIHAARDVSPDEYNQSPFISDLTEGKGGKVYKAHTYHTKVPHEAIARLILHYTQPDDLVLDAFAGCGMTGVAAAFCGDPDAKFRQSVDATMKVKWGSRRSILIDLSPFATFLRHNFTSPVSQADFQETANRLINDIRAEFPKTVYGDPSAAFLLWSQVLVCPDCAHTFPFAEVGVLEGAISSSFSCPSCGAALTKTKCERKTVTFQDPLLGTVITQNEYQLSWAIRGKGVLEPIKEGDRAAIRIGALGQPSGTIPVVPMMFKGNEWGDMYRAGYHFGVTHVHHFWTYRNLSIVDAFWRKAGESSLPNPMRFLTTSFMVKTGSRMHNIGMKGGNINLAGQIFNTLEIPSIFAERDLFVLAKGKAADLSSVYAIRKEPNNSIISTSSATNIDLPDECIDYIFIDPPFGGNIMYSEMSFLYEAWLGVFTNILNEAIVSTSQKKNLLSYRSRMTECFGELFRVLKPRRWITVAFHNSRNDVWNALQEAIRRAGFVVADVRVLDKGQGTFKQMTTAGAVEKDLAISAYRPSNELAATVGLAGGSPETARARFKTMMRSSNR